MGTRKSCPNCIEENKTIAELRYLTARLYGRAAYDLPLSEIVKSLVAQAMEVRSITDAAIQEFDLPKPPDNLHTADVLEKHLLRPLRERLANNDR